MTPEKNLKFLADRIEDEKEFYVCIDGATYRFRDFKLRYVEKDGTDYDSSMYLNYLLTASLKLKPTWEFTEDEKVILRNLEDRWKWIARDEDGVLNLYDDEPRKKNRKWDLFISYFMPFGCFRHLFQSVQWEDDEPCEFRKYI